MKYLLMTLATACALTISCERHEFEGKHGTKQLHEPHGAHDANPGTTDAHHASHDKE